MTRRTTFVPATALLLGLAASASAQPADPLVSEVPPPEEPVAAPPPPAPEPAPAPPAPVVAEEPDGGGRPVGTSFGIGVGYRFPTNVQTPNTTSVRVRFGSGLTLEPFATLSVNKQSTDTGVGDVESTTTEFGAGALVRYPVLRRGKIELELLGSAGFGLTTQNPDGDDNNTTTTALGLGWGLAVSYWMTEHWNFTLSATNPLLSFGQTSEQQAVGDDLTSSSTTIGATFDPVVSAMIHLYN